MSNHKGLSCQELRFHEGILPMRVVLVETVNNELLAELFWGIPKIISQHKLNLCCSTRLSGDLKNINGHCQLQS